MGCHVAVFDDVIQLFSDMKVCKSSTLEKAKKRKKLLPFCLSEYKKNIILAEANKILVINVDQTIDDPYTTFVKMLTGDIGKEWSQEWEQPVAGGCTLGASQDKDTMSRKEISEMTYGSEPCM
uniref:cofilin-1-like n=1 Tax=Macaca mulatta TaxID=9544 RepID=UPI0010A246C9|nr:cofilin-1-like [Macaca mulatta]